MSEQTADCTFVCFYISNQNTTATKKKRVAPQLLTTSNFIGPWYHAALLFSGLGSIVLLFGVLFSQQIREDLVRAVTSPKKANTLVRQNRYNGRYTGCNSHEYTNLLCTYQWFAPGWGVQATPGEFDIFRFSNVNFPTLGSPLRVKSLPLGITDLE